MWGYCEGEGRGETTMRGTKLSSRMFPHDIFARTRRNRRGRVISNCGRNVVIEGVGNGVEHVRVRCYLLSEEEGGLTPCECVSPNSRYRTPCRS